MASRPRLRALYGFLGAETNQWYPDLVYDNHPVEQPYSPEEGYHFSVDITDKALSFIRDAKAIAPDKPFFFYYCPGAAHAPHHVPKEWADKYKGRFDMGYEVYREQVFERQKELGVVTDKAELSPINPYLDEKGPDGEGWPELDTVRPWETLTDDEKKLFCRMAEVYAGFLSHADDQIGRLLDHLEESGELDNTLIILVSDNGVSGEGGPNGSVNENKIFNGLPDPIEDALPYIDELGGPLTYNHYPTGWACAFNTPFKLWKRYSNWEGGVADPMIVSWPKEIKGPRCAPPVRARNRHRSDDLRMPWNRPPRHRQGPHTARDRGSELRAHAHRSECRSPEGHAVLLHARHPRHLAQGLEGQRRQCIRAGVLAQLRRPSGGGSTTPRTIRASAMTWPRSIRRSCRR